MLNLQNKHQFYQFLGILTIPFFALSIVTQLYIFLPVTQNVAIITGSNLSAVGLLTTLFGISYALGLIIWGSLSDKFGRNRIIIIGLGLMAIMTFIIAFISDYSLLLFSRCLQGFFAASFPPVALAWLAENTSDTIRPRAIAFISCAFLLAGTIGQWFGYLTIHSSLHLAMWILSVIYILGMLLFCFIAKSNNGLQNQASTRTNNKSLLTIFSQIPTILFNKKLFKIYICALFVLLSFVALYVMLNTLDNSKQINPANLRYIAIPAMLFSLTSSYLFRLIKPLYVLAISLCLMSFSLIFQLIYLNSNVDLNSLLFLFHFLFVVSIAYAVPSMITCVTLFSHAEIRGIATSLYTCVLFIGASLGAFLPTCIDNHWLISFISIALLSCSIFLVATNNNE